MVEEYTTRRSRKAYFPGYFALFFLVALGIIAYYQKTDYSNEILFGAAAIFGTGLGAVEIHRARHKYHVDRTFVTHIEGLISKRTKKMALMAISDIDLEQKLWQRLLNCGNINIRMFGNHNEVYIKSVNKPDEMINFLQAKINEVQNNLKDESQGKN